jgi:hypothetical protein
MCSRFVKAGAAWSLLIVMVVVVGCGGKKQHHVSGKVLYNGEPLPAGVIWFDPAPKNDAPQGYAIIKNGAYNTGKDGGRGVKGGAYIIRIEGFDGKPGNELPLGKPLFTDFQQELELPMADSTQNFEIPAKK